MVLLASLVIVEGVTVEEVKIGVVMLVLESVVELLSVVSVKVSVVVSPDIVDGVRVVEVKIGVVKEIDESESVVVSVGVLTDGPSIDVNDVDSVVVSGRRVEDVVVVVSGSPRSVEVSG